MFFGTVSVALDENFCCFLDDTQDRLSSSVQYVILAGLRLCILIHIVIIDVNMTDSLVRLIFNLESFYFGGAKNTEKGQRAVMLGVGVLKIDLEIEKKVFLNHRVNRISCVTCVVQGQVIGLFQVRLHSVNTAHVKIVNGRFENLDWQIIDCDISIENNVAKFFQF